MFRNREFRQFAVFYFLGAAVFTALGFAAGTESGILCLGFSVVFGTAFFMFTKARYKRIAEISKQIDLVLHNEEHLWLDGLDEGELSILYSEITKMMLRIREQNEALKKDKTQLADSLADIAHQLRTPLTSANLILSFLESEPDGNERRRLVRETEELLVRMDWLISSLLKLSRLDAGVVEFQTEGAEAGSLIQNALRPLLIPMELHNIELKTDVPKGMRIQCDPAWLSEAVQNILKNCMESAGENGRIEISCEDNPLYTGIIIHDSGAGFKEEELPRLFDRFYRGKDSGNGAGSTGYGIGLALCKRIITQQGGTVAAKNHPQGGAVFSIRFPK